MRVYFLTLGGPGESLTTSDNLTWSTSLIDLYTNASYTNYSTIKSGYGTNALANLTWTGLDPAILTTNTGSEGFVLSGRYVDATGLIGLISFYYDPNSDDGFVDPSTLGTASAPVLDVYTADDSTLVFPDEYAQFTGLTQQDGISLDNVNRWARFALRFTIPPPASWVVYIRVEISEPSMSPLYQETRRVLDQFPHWMAMRELGNQPAVTGTSMATPDSLGGKLINDLAGEWLNELNNLIPYLLAQIWPAGMDVNQKAWAYKTTGAPQFVSTVTGDGVHLACAVDLSEFTLSLPSEDIYFWDESARIVYSNKKYTSLTINGRVVAQQPHSMWNYIDELGLRVTLFRLPLEDNNSFLIRILDVYINRGGVGTEQFKLALRRELNLWKYWGSTPDSAFEGATPEVLELSDLREDQDFFTSDGLPTIKFVQLVNTLASTYPTTWGEFIVDKAVWDPGGQNYQGFDRIPSRYDATPVPAGYFQPGIGDGNDLFVYAPDVITGPRDFTVRARVKGKQKEVVYSTPPVDAAIKVYGQASRRVYNNPTTTVWTSLEATLNPALDPVGTVGSVTFESFGTWTVPNGVTAVTVDMAGASGGSGPGMGSPGLGGRVQFALPVTPGQVFTFNVGTEANGQAPTQRDGGAGGLSHERNAYGAGGGSPTLLEISSGSSDSLVAVAGAGGGGGGLNGGAGGAGGDVTAQSGLPGAGGAGGGTGATATAIGVGGAGSGLAPSGSNGSGPAGPTIATNGEAGGNGGGSTALHGGAGGGGGGGYYGGGGGGMDGGTQSGGGGGGGSSWTDGAATGVVHQVGYQTGNGYVSFGYVVSSTTITDNVLVASRQLSATSDANVDKPNGSPNGYSTFPIFSLDGYTSPEWQFIDKVTGDPHPRLAASEVAQIVLLNGRWDWTTDTYIDSPSSDTFSTWFSHDPTTVLNYNDTGNVTAGSAAIFAATGSSQSYTTPSGCSYIHVNAIGGGGGDSNGLVPAVGGAGSLVNADIPLAGGATITVNVGTRGSDAAISGAAACTFGGGGTGFSAGAYTIGTASGIYQGAAGGGATDIRIGGTDFVNRALVAGGGGGANDNAFLTTGKAVTYTVSTGPQYYTVPEDCYMIDVQLGGAAGGIGSFQPVINQWASSLLTQIYGYYASSGLGAFIIASVPVVPGQVVQINVGGMGGRATNSSAGNGGYNGGGVGSVGPTNFYQVLYGPGGGGATDIRIGGTDLAHRVLVAAGGGGAGCNKDAGGNGGDITTTGDTYSGQQGSDTSGGTGGSGAGFTGQNGALGTGGNGNNGGAGGGGGYYGGGGGAGGNFWSGELGAGGGGSNYFAPFVLRSATAGRHWEKRGDGIAVITPRFDSIQNAVSNGGLGGKLIGGLGAPYIDFVAGAGGTQTNGGAGTDAGSGDTGIGGSYINTDFATAGGGGGYYGGGGSYAIGGGGGGSSFAAGSTLNVTYDYNTTNSDGVCTITPYVYAGNPTLVSLPDQPILNAYLVMASKQIAYTIQPWYSPSTAYDLVLNSDPNMAEGSPVTIQLQPVKWDPYIEQGLPKYVYVQLTSTDGTATPIPALRTFDENGEVVYINKSYLYLNGSDGWDGSAQQIVDPSTTTLVFNLGIGSQYPVTTTVWEYIEAVQLDGLFSGMVDQNGPWINGIPSISGNTNYSFETANLTREDFGLPETSDIVLTWIGLEPVSYDPQLVVWTDTSTILSSVSTPFRSTQDTNGAIQEYVNTNGKYAFTPFPVRVKLLDIPSPQWNPQVNSGWFYEGQKEYYLYTKPVTESFNSLATPISPGVVEQSWTLQGLNQQGAPIIVTTSNSTIWGPSLVATPVTLSTPVDLRQVMFFDASASPTTPSMFNIEYLSGTNSTVLYAAYDDIYDVHVVDQTLNTTLSVPVAATDNRIETSIVTDPSHTYKASYRVNSSFSALPYVTDVDPKLVTRLFFDQAGHYSATYESSPLNPATPIDIPLNPLYTTVNNGFIFISHNEYTLDQLNISVNPGRLISDGLDYTTVNLQSLDKFGNPKPNQVFTLTTTFGQLTDTQLTTNRDGYASTRLTADLRPYQPGQPPIAIGTVTASGPVTGQATFGIDPFYPPFYRLIATVASDQIPADGVSKNIIYGLVQAPDYSPVPYLPITWVRGRSVTDLISVNPGDSVTTMTGATPHIVDSRVQVGQTITGADGTFTIGPFTSVAGVPGYWFVNVVGDMTLATPSVFGSATPTQGPLVTDMVFWYEYPNTQYGVENLSGAALQAIQMATPAVGYPYQVIIPFPASMSENPLTPPAATPVVYYTAYYGYNFSFSQPTGYVTLTVNAAGNQIGLNENYTGPTQTINVSEDQYITGINQGIYSPGDSYLQPGGSLIPNVPGVFGPGQQVSPTEFVSFQYYIAQ